MRVYDFRTTERVPKEQVRLFEPLLKTTGRLAANRFSSWLGTAVDVQTSGVGEASYQQLLDPDADPQTLLVVYGCTDAPRIPEAMMVIPRPMLDGLIERLMGGDGKLGASPSRPVTDFDRAIAMKVAGKLLDSLDEGLDGRLSLAPTMKRAEMDRRRLPRNHAPTERYVIMSLRMTLDGQAHELRVALPAVFLRPLTEVAQEVPPVDPGSVDRCGRLPLSVRAEFCHRNVTLQEMLDLRPGRILVLDPKSVQNVVVRIEGEPKFAARPGRQGDRVVVEITRALTEEDHADVLG